MCSVLKAKATELRAEPIMIEYLDYYFWQGQTTGRSSWIPFYHPLDTIFKLCLESKINCLYCKIVFLNGRHLVLFYYYFTFILIQVILQYIVTIKDNHLSFSEYLSPSRICMI